MLVRYELGADVIVHYDPRMPARAVLEPGVGSGNLVRLAIAVAILTGGLATLAVGFTQAS
jgi:hypothetical protein